MAGQINHGVTGEVITDVSQVLPWHHFEVYSASSTPIASRVLGSVQPIPKPLLTGVFTADPQRLVCGNEGLVGGSVMALYQEGQDGILGRQRLGNLPLASLNILPDIDLDSVESVPWLELADDRICVLGPRVVPVEE